MKVIVSTLFILLCSLQYKLWLGSGSVMTMLQHKHKIQEQTLANNKLSTANVQLLQDSVALQTEDAAIEHKARSDLGMLKPGETFYQYLDNP